MSLNTRAIGKAGEDLALRYFKSNGFQIIDQNWRCRAGEIDLIVAKERMLYFVEVKARRTERFGSPLLAVHAAKQRKLRRLAEIYVATHKCNYAALHFACLGITLTEGKAEYDWLPQAFGV